MKKMPLQAQPQKPSLNITVQGSTQVEQVLFQRAVHRTIHFPIHTAMVYTESPDCVLRHDACKMLYASPVFAAQLASVTTVPQQCTMGSSVPLGS